MIGIIWNADFGVGDGAFWREESGAETIAREGVIVGPTGEGEFEGLGRVDGTGYTIRWGLSMCSSSESSFVI